MVAASSNSTMTKTSHRQALQNFFLFLFLSAFLDSPICISALVPAQTLGASRFSCWNLGRIILFASSLVVSTC